MKKKIIYYIFSIFAFCLLLTNVEAETVNKDDVPNSTYIIGTHMFTRNTNDVYEGQLTTKLIMMASKTIEGDSLDDMIIYYKNARGKWIDALSGTVIEVPNSFNIKYQDTKVKILTPTISLGSGIGADAEGNISRGLRLDNINVDSLAGAEVYFSEEENGQYILGKTVLVTDFYNINEVPSLEVPYGKHYYFKIRTFKTYENETVYSDYSNIVDINNILLGDVNLDGEINAKDKLVLRSYIYNIEPNELKSLEAADVDQDGVVDCVDLEILVRFDMGEIKKLPYESGEKFSITYNLDGGESSGHFYNKYGSSVGLGVQYPMVKEGYRFIGWSGSNGTTPEIQIAIEKGTTGDLEYTANWEKVDEPLAPTLSKVAEIYDRLGHLAFVIGIKDSGAYVDSQNKPSGVEFYEKGGDKYTLIETTENTTINYKIIEVKLAPGEKKTYVSRVYEIDSTGKKYYSSYSNEITLENKNLIVYNLEGGINSANNPGGYSPSFALTLASPTKEGYVFLGWTGSNGDTPELNVTIPKGTRGNLEYTANWALLGDINGDNQISMADFRSLEKYLLNEELTNDEVKNIEMGIGDVNLDGDTDDVDLDLVALYWNEQIEKFPYDSGKKYRVIYHLDDGVLLGGRNVYTQLTGFTLKKPTKEGYVFLGWTGSNGNVPQIKVDVEQGTTGDLEYTANWQEN